MANRETRPLTCPTIGRTFARVLALLGVLSSVACVSADGSRARAARHLFVATLDGTLDVVALDAAGDPASTVASLRVDDRLQFLAFHPAADVVYALGQRALHAIAWDAASGALTPLGEAAVGVRGTHVAIDPSGRCAIVASYADDAVVLLPLGADHVPGPPTVRLGGADDPTFRRAHQVRIHRNGRIVHVPCLGSDHVATLALDAATGSLTLLGTATTHDGAGPRHLDHHPSLPFAYVIDELASSVTVFRVDPGLGVLTPVDAVSTLPAGVTEPSRSSDVHVAPDGRHLYAANREPLDDLVVFAIGADGLLTPVEHVPTGGAHARTFALDAVLGRLWVGNTRSRDITTFAIAADGTLEEAPATWRAAADVYCVVPR